MVKVEKIHTDFITPEDMRIVDMNTNYLGVPFLLLMENAGRSIVEAIIENYAEDGPMTGKKVVLFAGLGNNGGDGFVAVRHLSAYGCEGIVILLGSPELIRTEIAKVNWQILSKMNLSAKLISLMDASRFKKLEKEVINADIIIDGILGTGIQGELREPIVSAINLMNSSKAFVVAIDLPTGLNPRTGEVQKPTVKANITVTFHKAKPGLLLEKNEEYTGKLIVKKIGIPYEAEYIAGVGDLAYLIQPRPPDSYKGIYGRILIVGGGRDYTGAPALAGISALRTGADLVLIATPIKVANSIRSFSSDIIVRELPGEVISEEGIPIIEEILKRSTCLIIGPGLGLEEETINAVLKILERVKEMKIPTVVDADGLKAMSKNPVILHGVPAVLTPHVGEYQILTGKTLPPPQEIRERMNKVKETAKELGVTMVLKANTDIISDGDRTKINTTGNPGMTVGGTGDVLTGIIGTFLSWGKDPFRAAVAGTFVSGAAGDLVCVEKGYQLLASDIIEKIPDIIKPFEYWRVQYKKSLKWLKRMKI